MSAARQPVQVDDMRLTALALAALALCLASAVRADDPVLSYIFSGKAMQGDRPVERDTIIEARVAGVVIGATTVADDEGSWSIAVDAKLFRSGICEAVFYIDGQLAGSQQINCSVELLLEAGDGGQPASRAEPDDQGRAKQGDDPPTDEDGADPQSADEPAEGGAAERATSQHTLPDAEGADETLDPSSAADSTPKAADELGEAEDGLEDDALAGAQPRTAPGTPETGSGGLADSPPWTAWLVAACPVVAGLVLWSRRLRSGR